MAIEVIVEKVAVGTPILGWASLMCVVLFSFGCMMLMMGILGEYVWRALDASRNRPPYLIDEIQEKIPTATFSTITSIAIKMETRKKITPTVDIKRIGK